MQVQELATKSRVVVSVSHEIVHDTEVPKIKYEIVVDGPVNAGIVKFPEHDPELKHPCLSVYSWQASVYV